MHMQLRMCKHTRSLRRMAVGERVLLYVCHVCLLLMHMLASRQRESSMHACMRRHCGSRQRCQTSGSDMQVGLDGCVLAWVLTLADWAWGICPTPICTIMHRPYEIDSADWWSSIGVTCIIQGVSFIPAGEFMREEANLGKPIMGK